MSKHLIRTIIRSFSIVVIVLSSITAVAKQVKANTIPVPESDMRLKAGLNLAAPNLLRFDGGELIGRDANRYQCVLNTLPFDVDLVPLPIARLQVMLAQGGIDLAILLTQTDERDKVAAFASPITKTVFQVITKHDELPNKSELSHWRIGGLRGSSLLEFAKVNLKANAIATSSWDSGLHMLRHGRLDGMILADTIIQADVDQSLLEGLNRFGVKEEYVSIYTSLKLSEHKKVYELIEQAINDCEKSGWRSITQ